MLTFSALGLLAGLIVSSWQGFKDPPWEGFSAAKFVRSPLVGAAAGAAAFWLDRNTTIVRVDNLGLLMLATLATERLAGEVYKGFLRPGFHAEYARLFERVGLPVDRTGVRLVLGLACLAGGITLYWWLGRFVGAVGDAALPYGASAMIIGGVIGTVVATGGALKDSQLEGFKPKKFVRSPIVSVLGAVLILRASADALLVALATIGAERVGVELYKTFLTRQVRGIHARRPPVYPEWFGRRWVFFVTFAAAVGACVGLSAR